MCSALSLITYDRKFEKAIESVFGGVLICKNLNLAKELAFHPRIRRKCVTLEGDVVDPAGVFEGGSAPKETPVLKSLEEIMPYEQRLKEIENEINITENKTTQIKETHTKWISLTDQLKVKQHALGVLQKALQQTSHYQLGEQIQHLKTEIASLNEKIKDTKDEERINTEKVKELETKAKDSKGYMEKQLKQAELEMKQLKQKAENSRENWKKHEQEYETLVLEVGELKKEIDNIKKQLGVVEQNIIELREKHDTAKQDASVKKVKLFLRFLCWLRFFIFCF